MGWVVVGLHGGVFEGSIHEFHLTIGLGRVGFGESMVDAILLAYIITLI